MSWVILLENTQETSILFIDPWARCCLCYEKVKVLQKYWKEEYRKTKQIHRKNACAPLSLSPHVGWHEPIIVYCLLIHTIHNCAIRMVAKVNQKPLSVLSETEILHSERTVCSPLDFKIDSRTEARTQKSDLNFATAQNWVDLEGTGNDPSTYTRAHARSAPYPCSSPSFSRSSACSSSSSPSSSTL